MKLWLLRHGEAHANVTTDAERALTEHGRQEVICTAKYLYGQTLDCILVSPYLRAQQSAELVRKQLAYTGESKTVPWIIPDSSVHHALPLLDPYEGQTLLLVTHQTFVGDLAGLLIHGHSQQPLTMPTGSLAELEGEALAVGLMRLIALHTP